MGIDNQAADFVGLVWYDKLTEKCFERRIREFHLRADALFSVRRRDASELVAGSQRSRLSEQIFEGHFF